jgi:hypothetical protein
LFGDAEAKQNAVPAAYPLARLLALAQINKANDETVPMSDSHAPVVCG